MKNIKIFALLTLLAIALFSISAPRFGTRSGGDNTGRTVNYGQQSSVSYKATITITPTGKFEEFVRIDSVDANSTNGNSTITIGTSGAKQWDRLTLLFDSVIIGTRTVTFSTGTLPNSTLALAAAKTATVEFVYDEARAKWIERFRTTAL